MKQLETLLNSLIQMGWKLWGKEYTAIDIAQDGRDECLMFWNVPKRHMKAYTLRNLVSLESGLWQFVCENKLVKQSQKQRVLNPTFGPEGADCDWSIQSNDFQYRLIESALIPEEELAQFLIDNIKTE